MFSFDSPVRTLWHPVPATYKFLVLCVCTFVLFSTDVLWHQVAALLCCSFLYVICGGVFFIAGVRRLCILWPILLVMLVWHAASNSLGVGVVISLRLVTLVALSNLVTLTTKLTEILEFVGTLLKPVRLLGINTRPVELAMALVVRFAPVLTEKGSSIVEAWQARSTRRPRWNIVFPLALAAIDDAEHVAEALKARGGASVPRQSEITHT